MKPFYSTLRAYTPRVFSLVPLLFFLLLSASMAAQNRHTLSGTVRDGSTGETLIGATVQLPKIGTGTVTNEYGFYSLTLPENVDTIGVLFSYIGFNPKALVLPTNKDSVVNMDLFDGQAIEEVVIEANSNMDRVQSTQMGLVTITAQQAKILPSFFGEVDILKTLQLKPGVLSGGEGVSGMYVRGGGQDQNLFVLDEAPVYNPSHMFGFFSTFNSDAVKNVELYKSSFPAQYGGKLSSVIDVQLNEGNRKKFSVAGGIGLISSRLTLEGPIVKDKVSFIVSGRRTYADLITRAINSASPNANIPNYYFYDLNTKINYDISDKDKVYLSGYFGRDVFEFNDDEFSFGFDWGNATLTARWNHIFNQKLFSNTVFTFSDYKYKVASKFDAFQFSLGSGIRDFNLKNDYGWYPSDKHSVRFGLNVIHHIFKVNSLDASSDDGIFDLEAGSTYSAQEAGLYINDEFKVSPSFSINAGLRFSGFLNSGKAYGGIEPRLSARYSLSDVVSLKASYARMYQYIHLVSNSAATLPTDVWYPSTARVRPQISDQVSVGVNYAISNDFFFSSELFYKQLYNQIDFREGAQLIANDDLDGEFVFGKGNAYGGEVYLEKKNGKVTGWVGYTLTWAWRQFDQLNNGERFRPRYDRRHDISLVLMWEVSKRWVLSGTWVYGTGNAFSLPDGRFNYFDQNGIPNFNLTDQGVNFLELNLAPVYTERNKYRLPSYHRLDVSVMYKLSKPEKRFQSDLTLSFYNAYDRRNPFFIYYDTVDENGDNVPERVQPKVVSLFPILPSLTWNFKF